MSAPVSAESQFVVAMDACGFPMGLPVSLPSGGAPTEAPPAAASAAAGSQVANDVSGRGSLTAALLAQSNGADEGDSPTTHTPKAPLLPRAAERKRGPRSPMSKFRGVSCYKRTGRWESHIWSTGKQVHLGSFKDAMEAARAYDRAAICFRGWNAETNFDPEEYRDDPILATHMANDSVEEFIAWLRKGGKEDGGGGAAEAAAAGEGGVAASAVPTAAAAGAAAPADAALHDAAPSKPPKRAKLPAAAPRSTAAYALPPPQPPQPTFASCILPSRTISEMHAPVPGVGGGWVVAGSDGGGRSGEPLLVSSPYPPFERDTDADASPRQRSARREAEERAAAEDASFRSFQHAVFSVEGGFN